MDMSVTPTRTGALPAAVSALQAAFRKAAMLYFMNGGEWAEDFEPWLEHQLLVDIHCKLALFGEQVAVAEKRDTLMSSMMQKAQKSELDLLPAEFTWEDYCSFREAHGKSVPSRYENSTLRNSVRSGKVQVVEPRKRFRKV